MVRTLDLSLIIIIFFNGLADEVTFENCGNRVRLEREHRAKSFTVFQVYPYTEEDSHQNPIFWKHRLTKQK